MYLFFNKLCIPYCSAVPYPQVPVSSNRNCWVKWHFTYLAFYAKLFHLPTIIGAFLSSVKIAVKFLLYHVIWHTFAALRLNLLRSKHTRFFHCKNFKEPFIRIALGNFSKFLTMIGTTRSVNECGPPTISSKNRLNEVVSHRIHQGPLAKYYTPRICTHDGIVTVRTYQLYQGLSFGTIDPDLHFCVIWVPVYNCLWNIVEHPFAIVRHTIPNNPLGLRETRKEVVICPRL